MVKAYYWVLTVLLSCLSQQTLAIDIRHAEARKGSSMDQYAIDLIRFIAEKSGESVNLIPHKVPNSQTRRELQLSAGKYDIGFFGFLHKTILGQGHVAIQSIFPFVASQSQVA